MLQVILAPVLGLLLMFIFLHRRSYRRMSELAEKIPGPKPLPILGNALEFGTSTKAMFLGMNRMNQEYGPVARMWIAADLFVLISGAKYLESIFNNSKLLDKAITYRFLHPWLGTGLLTGTGNKWRVHRKLITPTFHFRILEKFVENFNSNGEILINKLSKHIGGPEFDVFPYITLYALDVICETAMGVKVNAQEDSDSEYVKSLRGMCEVIMKRSFWPWYQKDLLFALSPLARKQAKWLSVLHGTTMTMIATKKQQLESAPPNSSDLEEFSRDERRKLSFLDLLLVSSKEEGNQSILTDEEIREEVDTFMFEGHDTTAAAMSFACHALGMNQEVQANKEFYGEGTMNESSVRKWCIMFNEGRTSMHEDQSGGPSLVTEELKKKVDDAIQERAINEIREIFQDSDRSATYQDLQNMCYLDKVIKETLRLYPSVPVYGRVLTEELAVGEYILPVGCNILINAFIAHQDPTYFPDPLVFNPERFSAENSQGRHPFAYIPFSAGARNCVGQKFAMLEMKATLCKILRHYKILNGSTPLDLADDVTLKSNSGIMIRLERRCS